MADEIQKTERLTNVLTLAADYCLAHRHEFVTPEHVLYMLCTEERPFRSVLAHYCLVSDLSIRLEQVLGGMEQVPEDNDYELTLSYQTTQILNAAAWQVANSSARAVGVPHIVDGMFSINDSWACQLLKEKLGDDRYEFMSRLISEYEHPMDDAFYDEDDEFFNDEFLRRLEDDDEDEDEENEPGSWRRLVTCMNDTYANENPLIGREHELERTLQVLCRRDKNNPLHVGEPGVGKTALVYGLTARIESGQVPQRLLGARVYKLDVGQLIAGTQYRGDFERRITRIMKGVMAEGHNNIIYIDEIHTLVGAGSGSDSSLDASNMLKPYLEAGSIRFIGSTTYEEYNKYFSKSKGLVRRFQQIDILEPSVDETIHILQQLRPRYEQFHGVVYEDEAIEMAVRASAKYVNDRFLPDKAIDLIDEAGAALEVAPPTPGSQPVPVVGRQLISEILAKTCKVDALAMKEDEDNSRLQTLSERIGSQLFGQDEAVQHVVQAVQMAKAGLTDDGKPLSSLLFVGPTGVGKTELARLLARELGIELLRFDMSEYTEKHTVAKLIGSPAGYVGYEDGGLLTDAIRRTPNCVLLLDEIEKAHQDIYNILLQVMDYARLTDNKGRKADFRNVILIMTSNAGAQYASQASVGFGHRVERGQAMLSQVKKTFKPEFINRLSATVVFHDMDRDMARRILDKKLGELQQKLSARNVQMTLGDKAIEQLLEEGFTREYGAREMDRVISQRLKPRLMREILFGSLKNGGTITITSLDEA